MVGALPLDEGGQIFRLDDFQLNNAELPFGLKLTKARLEHGRHFRGFEAVIFEAVQLRAMYARTWPPCVV